MLDQAARLMTELAVLRDVITLASEAPALTDDQLRGRLIRVLAEIARAGCQRD